MTNHFSQVPFKDPGLISKATELALRMKKRTSRYNKPVICPMSSRQMDGYRLLLQNDVGVKKQALAITLCLSGIQGQTHVKGKRACSQTSPRIIPLLP